MALKPPSQALPLVQVACPRPPQATAVQVPPEHAREEVAQGALLSLATQHRWLSAPQGAGGGGCRTCSVLSTALPALMTRRSLLEANVTPLVTETLMVRR